MWRASIAGINSSKGDRCGGATLTDGGPRECIFRIREHYNGSLRNENYFKRSLRVNRMSRDEIQRRFRRKKEKKKWSDVIRSEQFSQERTQTAEPFKGRIEGEYSSGELNNPCIETYPRIQYPPPSLTLPLSHPTKRKSWLQNIFIYIFRLLLTW